MTDSTPPSSGSIESGSIEERLRNYATVLDRAAAAHDRQTNSTTELILEPEVATPSSRRRPIQVAAFLAAAAAAIGALALTATRHDDEVIRATPGPPSSSGSDRGPAGEWRTLPESPLSPRAMASAVWTGTEVIVWGGRSGATSFNDGAAYDPVANSWRPIAPSPWAQTPASAAWTGSQMVVAAGQRAAAYDPATDAWTQLPSLTDSGFFWDVDSIAYTGGLIFATSAPRADFAETSTIHAATIRLGDPEWELSPPYSRVREFPQQGKLMALGDGSVVLPWGTTTALRFDPVTGDWGTLPSFPAPDGWTVTSASFAAHQGLLRAVVDLRRSDTIEPSQPPSAGTAQVLTVGPVPEGGAQTRLATLLDGGWSVTPATDAAAGPFAELVTDDDRLYLWSYELGAGVVSDIEPWSGTATKLPAAPGQHGFAAAMTVAGGRFFVWGGDLDESGMPGDAEVSGDGSMWIPIPAPPRDQAVQVVKFTPRPAPTTEPSTTTAPPTTAPSTDLDDGIPLLDVAPWAFEIEGLGPCEPIDCPTVASNRGGALVAYSRNGELSMFEPETRTIPVSDEIPKNSTYLLAIGPDDVAYLVTHGATPPDTPGDLVAVSLSGPQAGSVVARAIGVADSSGDTDYVAARDGIVAVGCCNGDVRPNPDATVLMEWVDRTGQPITDDSPTVSIENVGERWEVVVTSTSELRWPIPHSTNGFRGMPRTALQPGGGVVVSWVDPGDGTERLYAFRLSGRIERIRVPDGWSVVLLDQAGAVMYDGGRFLRWALPTLTDPVDATASVLQRLGGSSDAATADDMIDRFLAALRRPDGCDLAPTATVTDRIESDSVLTTIEYRFGCDDSGGGLNYELTIAQQPDGQWAITAATSQTLCLRGGGTDYCV